MKCQTAEYCQYTFTTVCLQTEIASALYLNSPDVSQTILDDHESLVTHISVPYVVFLVTMIGQIQIHLLFFNK